MDNLLAMANIGKFYPPLMIADSVLSKTEFSPGADFQCAQFLDTEFEEASFQGVNLRGAKFISRGEKKTDLSQVNWTGANLDNVEFTGVKFGNNSTISETELATACASR